MGKDSKYACNKYQKFGNPIKSNSSNLYAYIEPIFLSVLIIIMLYYMCSPGENRIVQSKYQHALSSGDDGDVCIDPVNKV